MRIAMWNQIFVLIVGVPLSTVFGQSADWPEPRHDRHLTGVQPAGGIIRQTPIQIGEIDLGRAAPAAIAVDCGGGRGTVWVSISGGELRGYESNGKRAGEWH